MVIELGRLCLKTAGRDASKKCLVIDIVDKNFVMIDGETRRKRCNILHLEPLSQKLEVKKGASHEEVKEVFKNLGIELKDKKPKEAKADVSEKETKEENQKKDEKPKSKK